MRTLECIGPLEELHVELGDCLLDESVIRRWLRVAQKICCSHSKSPAMLFVREDVSKEDVADYALLPGTTPPRAAAEYETSAQR